MSPVLGALVSALALSPFLGVSQLVQLALGNHEGMAQWLNVTWPMSRISNLFQQWHQTTSNPEKYPKALPTTSNPEP